MNRCGTFIALCAGLFFSASFVSAVASAQPAANGAKDMVWSFDETSGVVAHDSATGHDDAIQGLWRRVPGVRGTALEFDGYTTNILREGKTIPHLGNAFTVSAWVAIDAYPWNWVPIVDQSDHREVGYSLDIDSFGHVGFDVSVDGVWQHVSTDQTLPLKQWRHVTGVFDGDAGLSIFIDGNLAGSLKTTGAFWQAKDATLYMGRVLGPVALYPVWLAHPFDPIEYSFEGLLDEVKVLNHAVTQDEDKADVASAHKPEGDVLPYAVMPAGPAGPGPFGAIAATLHFSPTWDRLRRIGPDSDVVVRFEQSGMRLVFWQGTNYVPAWVTENGKWYTDEFLETWGPGCNGAQDCEPMSDKQGRYSHASIVATSPARAIVHWRYALAEAHNYEGANADPLSGWTDWADEYWTVYPDGVAVRKQVLWSSDLSKPHEWQETIVLNGPGFRPEDDIEPNAFTLENMAGETENYNWGAKTDHAFSIPKGPASNDLPKGANIQIVHLKSPQNPFQIVWPRGVSHDVYNGEQSYSMFEWWNHWPVAQVGSSGRPALAADRPSHTSLSHIVWDPYEKTSNMESKLLLCGLTQGKPGDLLPLAKSWISPPTADVVKGDGATEEYDPAQRAFVVHRKNGATPGPLTIGIASSEQSPVVNPAIVIENWNGPAKVSVLIDGKKTVVPVRSGVEPHLEGDSLVLFLTLDASRPVQVSIEPSAVGAKN